MNKVQELDASIVDAKEAWEANKDTLPDAERIPVSNAVDVVSELLKEIISLEGTQQDSISEQKKRNRKDVTKINKGQQVMKAYGAAYMPGKKLDSLVDKRT